MSRDVTVIGAGTMGRGIALAFAMSDATVRLVDVSELSLRTAERALAADLSVVTRAVDAGPILSRLSYGTALEQAVSSADLVVESVPEDLGLKCSIWEAIGRAARQKAVLASNTSSFDVSTLARLVPHPGRVLGLHFFNPAHLVPCVEVVRAKQTEERHILAMKQLLVQMGKRPAVVASKPGFVANRIQMAMVAEAFRCLEEGVASAEDIDDIVRHALGHRLVDLGPFQIGDLAGLDVYAAIYSYLTQTIGERFRAPSTLIELVAAGNLGVKSGSGVYRYTGEQVAEVIRRRDASFASRSGLAVGAP